MLVLYLGDIARDVWMLINWNTIFEPEESGAVFHLRPTQMHRALVYSVFPGHLSDNGIF